jgi:hypothetical protein
MLVEVHGTDLPGRTYAPAGDGMRYENIHVGLCCRTELPHAMTVEPKRPWRVEQAVSGDAPSARWVFEVGVIDGESLDFRGRYVRGTKDDRHISLAWGEIRTDGLFHLFRGADLCFSDIDPLLVRGAMARGTALVGRLGLTDENGNPRCTRIRPPSVTWSTEPTSFPST